MRKRLQRSLWRGAGVQYSFLRRNIIAHGIGHLIFTIPISTVRLWFAAA